MRVHAVLWFALSIIVGNGPVAVAQHVTATVGGPITLGRWQAAVEVPGGELRFTLDLAGSIDDPEATLVNGAGTTPVDRVTIAGDSLQLRLFVFDSAIDAVIVNGELVGTLRLTKRGGVIQEMPFRATYAQGFVTTLDVTSVVDVSGRWRVRFADDDGHTTPAVGEFHQEGTTLSGTFLTATGDYRFLSGSVIARELYLSCFDGGHAFLFKAMIGSDDTITGDFWSGTRWHETWTAQRDERAALPNPDTLTRVSESAGAVAFAFPDTAGRVFRFPDARFKGKVVLIVLAGSWCPNCHDEAAFLSRLYESRRDSGLEIVGLMYENYRDFGRAAQQVSHFHARHNIEFPLLIAGYSDKKEASETLPWLSSVVAYPTLIAIDRAGDVRRVHTGFSGPGTGEHYDALVSDLSDFVDALLDER